MAKFIDQRNDEDEEEFESLEAQDEAKSEAQPEPPAEEPDEIPEKYRGKELKDIVRMHQEAEKLLGRQSQEVGELRRTFDEYIKTQLAQQETAHTSTATEEVDFFEDPKKAVDYAIAHHPKIKEAETVSQQLKRSEALARLKAEHPDYETIISDEKFGEWVGKSKFRVELLNRADKQFDFDAADELLSSWKERQNVMTETKKIEEKNRKDSVKKASTGNTRGSADAPSRKVYRRADIIKLMQTDPERYIQLAPEIRQAYAEGRVK
jgi:hypothetical protein